MFSFGGDEVELSVWDFETAIAPNQQAPSPPPPQPESSSSNKWKRVFELRLVEVWQTKRVSIQSSHAYLLDYQCVQATDELVSLRQHVHNLCIPYISTTSQQLLADAERRIRLAQGFSLASSVRVPSHTASITTGSPSIGLVRFTAGWCTIHISNRFSVVTRRKCSLYPLDMTKNFYFMRARLLCAHPAASEVTSRSP